MKSKIFLSFFLLVFFCVAVFSGIAFLFSREKLLGVEVPKNDVPYIDGRYIPEDCTVLVVFEDGSGAAVQILFEKQMTNVLLLSPATSHIAESCGYTVNQTVNCDYSFLMKFVDILGGIEIQSGYTLTGVQVCNLLAEEKDSPETAKNIIKGIFNKISKNGFTTDALYCIIEETETSLSSPACYGWVENLKYCSVAVNIVDGR